VEIVKGIARETVGRRMILPGRAKAWWDEELAAAVNARRATFLRWRATGRSDMALAAEYQMHRIACKALFKDKKRQHTDAQHARLTSLHRTNQRAFWRAMNATVGGRSTATARGRVAAVADPTTGNLVTDDAGIARVFGEHAAVR